MVGQFVQLVSRQSRSGVYGLGILFVLIVEVGHTLISHVIPVCLGGGGKVIFCSLLCQSGTALASYPCLQMASVRG